MSSDEFTEYLTELETPNTEGYEFFVRNEGVGYFLEIYRQFEKVTNEINYWFRRNHFDLIVVSH